VQRGDARAGAGKAASDGGEYAYVEVMACPGGCTNGGGQIRAGEVAELREGAVARGDASAGGRLGPKEQKEWLAKVDEAYFSGGSGDEDGDGGLGVGGDAALARSTARRESVAENGEDVAMLDEGCDDGAPDVVNGISTRYVRRVLTYWADLTGCELSQLVGTTFREVESDVGKSKGASDMERVVGLASAVGGGW
jgi:hypothetical protein